MKTNFKLSSKMHLFIIISCVIIALGVAVGVICQFVAGGFYNYGADWSSNKSVTVTYENVDYSDVDDIVELCNDAFSSQGIKSKKVTVMNGETNTGGRVVYEFTYSTDYEAIAKAVNAIEQSIKSEVAVDGVIRLTYASGSNDVAVPEAGKALWRGIIAVSVAVVFGFVYFVIRYRLSMAFSVLLACVHNFALYAAIVALVRIPVGSSVITFGALTVIVTLLGCCILFDRVRKNAKNEELRKLGSFELTDLSANESLAVNILAPACLCAVALVLFILMSISSLSPLAILSPAMLALVTFVACAYGTAIFTPAVYSRFKKISDDNKSKHVAAKKAKADNK